jgi:hypothetical protein
VSLADGCATQADASRERDVPHAGLPDEGAESSGPSTTDAAAVRAESPVPGPEVREPVAAPSGPPPLVSEDLTDDGIVGPPEVLDDCTGRLTAASVEWSVSRIPVHETKGGLVCGAPEVVRYAGGPSSIRWSKSSPKVTCGLALSLGPFERIVQEEAERCFGRRVVKIEHMGTYNCREMAAYPGWVSEHSYGNAIDIKRFVLAGGKTVDVLGHYGDAAAGPSDPASRFLQAVAARAYDENVFSVVLTPAFDRAHRNHFHLDLARYRVDGTGRP